MFQTQKKKKNRNIMCVLISEPSLLGVKGFIGAVRVLLGAQAGGPGLLQGCSLCGSVKPVTPSLLSDCGREQATAARTHEAFWRENIWRQNISKLLPVEPRQFPSLPSARAPHKELRVLLVCELSEEARREIRSLLQISIICARSGRETLKLSVEGSLCNWIYCNNIF